MDQDKKHWKRSMFRIRFLYPKWLLQPLLRILDVYLGYRIPDPIFLSLLRIEEFTFFNLYLDPQQWIKPILIF
jgi:hypothetical protein